MQTVFIPHQGNISSQRRLLQEKPQPIKLQRCGAQFQWLHLQTTPTSKAQGTLQKREQKVWKSQRMGVGCEFVSPRKIRSCTCKAYPHHCSIVSGTKMETIGHAKLDREKSVMR